MLHKYCLPFFIQRLKLYEKVLTFDIYKRKISHSLEAIELFIFLSLLGIFVQEASFIYFNRDSLNKIKKQICNDLGSSHLTL